jgi:chromosome partitioning protein
VITSIVLQKGGVGKSTTAVCCSCLLAQRKKKNKVLLIDLDSQANSSMSMGFLKPESLDKTILEVLQGDVDINECIYPSQYKVDVIPSKSSLSGFIITSLTNSKKFGNPMLILRDKLTQLRQKYDHIIIDLPPELGIFTMSGLIASDNILIPLQAEARSTRGVDILLEMVENIRQTYNSKLSILGIVGTMFSKTNLCTTVFQETRKHFQGKIRVFDTVIYRTIKFAEADYYNMPAVFYSDAEQVQNYKSLVKEMFKDE